MTPWTPPRQASLSFSLSWSLLRFMSIELVMLFSHLILSCPLLLLPSVFPSIKVFSSELTLHIRWPKRLELQLQHQFFQWIFRVDFLYNWLVWPSCCPRDSQSLLQHHNSKTSILWCSAFFMAQLSHPWMTRGKTTALIIWSLVGEVMSLFFNTLSRFVIAFLPRSKRLLILWLQSLSAVILESKEIKSVTVFIVSPSICHEVMGLDAMILVFWMLSFKPIFSLSFHFHLKRLFSSSSLLP